MILGMQIIGEHYHVYNRGAHKAPIFQDKSDYERFWALLYVANDTKPLKRHWTNYHAWPNIVIKEKLVDIFCYCLMPNHFHLGLVEISESGIELFMHKVSIAYTMYYNKKYDHSGTIFQGRYKSKHIDNDGYLKILIEYIHLNPYGIEGPDLNKYSKPEYYIAAAEYSKSYEYSSYMDYLNNIRPQNSILTVRYVGD